MGGARGVGVLAGKWLGARLAWMVGTGAKTGETGLYICRELECEGL